MKKHTNVYEIGQEAEGFFTRYGTLFPDPELDGNTLSDGTRVLYREILGNRSFIEPWMYIIENSLRAVSGSAGYIILDASSLCGHARYFTFLTALLVFVGVPIRVFNRWDLWKPIQTDLTIEPMRAGGTGMNPLHIDFVNATNPPDYSCLLCMKEDPRGGGRNIVSNLQIAVAALSESERTLLSEAVFREGQFYELSCIGEELNPFPVLELESSGMWRVRFTRKMRLSADSVPRLKAFERLADLLDEQRESFHLRTGQLLITNQNVVCHGREPLGVGQSELVPASRRELRQVFLRDMEKLET